MWFCVIFTACKVTARGRVHRWLRIVLRSWFAACGVHSAHRAWNSHGTQVGILNATLVHDSILDSPGLVCRNFCIGLISNEGNIVNVFYAQFDFLRMVTCSTCKLELHLNFVNFVIYKNSAWRAAALCFEPCWCCRGIPKGLALGTRGAGGTGCAICAARVHPPCCRKSAYAELGGPRWPARRPRTRGQLIAWPTLAQPVVQQLRARNNNVRAKSVCSAQRSIFPPIFVNFGTQHQ